MAKSVLFGIVDQLRNHLKANVTSLAAIYDEFPNPSQNLKYPCLTILSKSPKFQNGLPYTIAKSSDPSGKTRVRRCVGIWEIPLQLDVWCSTKFERNELLQQVFAALGPNSEVMGVSLQLSDYYNEWSHYTMTGLTYPDAEQESQRSEWRMKIDVIADVKAIMEVLDYTIQTIENNITTPEDIPAEAIGPTPAIL